MTFASLEPVEECAALPKCVVSGLQIEIFAPSEPQQMQREQR